MPCIVMIFKPFPKSPYFVRCEQEIKNRVRSLENTLLECQDRLLMELDKTTRLMAEDSNFQNLRDLSLCVTDLSPTHNILGFLAVDGLLPSNLHLLLSSPLTDLRPDSSLMFSVEAVANTEVTLKPGWDQKIKVQVSFTDSEGEEKLIRMKKKTEGTKRLLKFEANEAGVYQVSATLYENHINNSPFLVPVVPDLLETIGIDYRGLEDSEVTPGKSDAVKKVMSVKSEHSKSEVINSMSEREPEKQNVSEDQDVSSDGNPSRCS